MALDERRRCQYQVQIPRRDSLKASQKVGGEKGPFEPRKWVVSVI